MVAVFRLKNVKLEKFAFIFMSMVDTGNMGLSPKALFNRLFHSALVLSCFVLIRNKESFNVKSLKPW